MKYVIIGNGAAAIGTVEGIRKLDRNGDIAIISSENHHAYSRPLISYYLDGRTDIEKMKYRPDSFYKDNRCKTLFGKTVEKIDASAHTVILNDGATLAYDKLCVATGSRPFLPDFEGIDTVPNRFSFMTLDDALSLDKAVTAESRVFIIGAGLIGLKCAEGLKNRVKSITVTDMSQRVLSSIIDEDCASVIQNKLTDNGIKLLLGDSVMRFDKNTAYMKSGCEVTFDILVTAVGVRANTSLVSDAGGKVSRGIEVSPNMKTSLDGIYAAGDCTESFDISCDTHKIIAILPNAYLQGECAGQCMAGGEAVFDKSIPMNAIGFFGLHMLTAGAYCGEVYKKKTKTGLKRLFYENNLLKGFILIGDVDKAGIYTSLIRNKTPLDTLDFGLVKDRPSLMAFSRDYRNAALAEER